MYTQTLEPLVDIQARNILIALASQSPVLDFIAAEQEHPIAPKVINERRSIYVSRSLPHFLPPGPPTICDFGHAVVGSPGAKHNGVTQPLPYRAPEVILGIPWGAEADIWNLGALVSYITV
jgi:serine/threonine protein kinase